MSEQQALLPGARVEQLRIDRVLGQGAFGVTYLVTDTVLDKTFALKEYLPRDLVTREEDGSLKARDPDAAGSFASGLARFLEEGRTVARLDHPNIVTVFRCIEANGTAYLLMPWYRGEALHRLMKRSGTLDPDETLALCRPLFDALEYIHRNGVVHQDVKPANIYITTEGHPILLDFGAAGQFPHSSAAARRKLGSAGYAAPEQSDPAGWVGPWTDVYGLAATLYRCVSGQIPVDADSRREALGRQEDDPLEPLGRLVDASRFGPIAEAIDRGLRMDPATRPRDVGEWRGEFRAGPGPASGDAGPVEQEGREWLSLVLLGIFGVVLISAVVYLFTAEGPGESGDAADPETTVEAKTPPVRGSGASPEETRRWEDALEADTAYGYQLFLDDYPESIHRDQAKLHIERLDHQAWGRAEQEGSKAAIEDYMTRFPGGQHEAEAKIRLEEFRLAEEAERRAEAEAARRDDEAWDSARGARTIAAIDGYLQAWPAGRHADEARELRGRLQNAANDRKAFEAAKKLGTIDGYQSYVDAFPRGAGVAEALEAIDDLTLRPGKTFRDCDGCPTLVVVPAGSYWQGSEDSSPLALKSETPRRMVTIAEPFAVGIYEVTLAQWDQCVSEGGCSTRPRDNGWGRGSRPVIMVSWNDAQEYTDWLSKKTGQSYSLPSESQWEYIARAGEETDWLGGDSARVCEYGNVAGGESGFRWQHGDCADTAAMETLPVGTLRANGFGVYDVVGNVAEWTMDCMNLSYLDAPSDGSAWGRGICSSRMTRGGSWFTGTREIRLPARFNLKNGDRNDFTGFRVVRRVEES
ncbi:MAG: SUMF1/EgtB/PvdO family nonheme iron enzyme [Gammaproteobacteria bacterium]|nr:SUMF1/EgtB/PvdO family nonheme iron enzyme [Gammaproteobacteria bacterium]